MIKNILVSRIDNLGDVILTLPLGGVLKKIYPDAKITFLLKSYTAPIGKISQDFDNFMLWDEWENKTDAEIAEHLRSQTFDMVVHVYPVKRISALCYKAKIPIRIATAHRLYNWKYCNKLSFFSRKSSDFHESQLNLKLIESLSKSVEPTSEDLKLILENVKINYALIHKSSMNLDGVIDKSKFNLILHPKSFGSALEWPLELFRELVEKLDSDKYNIIITGTKKEEVHLEMGFLNPLRDKVVSCVGSLSLEQLMALMLEADGIIAASTGPLHLGSILGLNTLGLFPSKRPIFPLRWLPIGPRTTFLLSRKSGAMNDIKVSAVLKKISYWDKLVNDI